MVFIDPPFGFNVDTWDTPELVWSESYWVRVFTSLQDILQDSAAIVIFGDIFTVLPPLLAGVKLFNEVAETKQLPKILPPVQICFQKVNKPHKSGKTGYAQSVENAFIFHFQSYPKLLKYDFDVKGNLLTAARVVGARRLKNSDRKWINPCQKPHIWLRYFIDNNTTSNSLVLDLTAGSFSSFFACYFNTKPIHWAGCDIGPDTIKNWEFFQRQIEDESILLERFYEGIIFQIFFKYSIS